MIICAYLTWAQNFAIVSFIFPYNSFIRYYLAILHSISVWWSHRWQTKLTTTTLLINYAANQKKNWMMILFKDATACNGMVCVLMCQKFGSIFAKYQISLINFIRPKEFRHFRLVALFSCASLSWYTGYGRTVLYYGNKLRIGISAVLMWFEIGPTEWPLFSINLQIWIRWSKCTGKDTWEYTNDRRWSWNGTEFLVGYLLATNCYWS